ncbi:unnamed protein product, partial [Prorocentrum cordatum]
GGAAQVGSRLVTGAGLAAQCSARARSTSGRLQRRKALRHPLLAIRRAQTPARLPRHLRSRSSGEAAPPPGRPSDDTSQWDAYANPPPADAGPPSTGTPPPAAPPVLLRPPAGTALGGYAGGRPRQPRHHRQGRPHQAWQQRPAPRPGA